MRSLRLFFNDENCTSGQLVIASRESQYKILHFHHGGLDHLAQVLHQWHCLLHNIKLAPGKMHVKNIELTNKMIARIFDISIGPGNMQVLSFITLFSLVLEIISVTKPTLTIFKK